MDETVPHVRSFIERTRSWIGTPRRTGFGNTPVAIPDAGLRRGSVIGAALTRRPSSWVSRSRTRWRARTLLTDVRTETIDCTRSGDSPGLRSPRW